MTTPGTASFFSRVQLPEIMLFFYGLALLRQYLWIVPNDLIAWALTIVLAVAIFWFVLRNRRDVSDDHRLSWPFYLLVALPLFFIYAIRCAYPDVSFDVMHYHIIVGERALSGFPSRAGDFFAVDFMVNPLSDMIPAIFRHLLGYRGGTIVNYLALLWTGTIIVRFLRRRFTHRWLVPFATLVILLTETLLFEINNYMVDLLAVPILLEATYLLVFPTKRESANTDFYIGFLLGLALAFKVTNVTFVVPLGLLWLSRGIARERPARACLLFTAGVILPMALYTVYLYNLTGNPVYPLFHDLFTSTDLPSAGGKDSRWGPATIAQAPLWPAMLHWQVNRISELNIYEGQHIYAGKVSLGFLVAILLLLFQRSAAYLKKCSFLMLLGALLWSVTTGYVRYACYLEVLAGILAIYAIGFIMSECKRTGWARPILLAPVIGSLTVLSWVSIRHVAKYEWSMRPTIFDNPKAYLESARFLFRDYSLVSFLCSDTVSRFGNVDVWIKSGPLSSAFQAGLKPNIPAINVRTYLPPNPSRPGSSGAEAALSAAEGRRMFSLSHSERLQSSVDAIKKWGLNIGRVETVLIPYYSEQTVYQMVLIEVLPRRQLALANSEIKFSVAEARLPEAAFRASITPGSVVKPGECFGLSENQPIRLKAGSRTAIQVRVANTSAATWPALGRADGAYKINLGNHWRANGNGVIRDDVRAGLLFDLPPGQEVAVPITVTAPSEPGAYSLEFDMVQEQIGWFAAAGSQVATVDVVVE